MPSPAGVKQHSLAIPKGLAVSGDGTPLYLAAKGSGKIGVFPTQALEDDSFTRNAASHIPLSAGGPTGVVLDEGRDRLYVLTRFDNGISSIDTQSATEVAHLTLPNPGPVNLVQGRRFLYDAHYTSSNGEAACASCHIEADKDELAWDLGNPLDSVRPNPNPFTIPSLAPVLHPMKGPMITQTLRGMASHGPMHWRGDRTGAFEPGGDHLDAAAAFGQFNGAFVGLLGRETPLTSAEMQAFTDFVLQLTPPPNPIRNLDDSLTPDQATGRDVYFNVITDRALSCNGCHVLDPANGRFGTDGNVTFEGETQDLKIPHLRNMYEKVGMFGVAGNDFFTSRDNQHMGPQIRGFGFEKDGSADTVDRFLSELVFDFPGGLAQRRQVEIDCADRKDCGSDPVCA